MEEDKENEIMSSEDFDRKSKDLQVDEEYEEEIQIQGNFLYFYDNLFEIGRKIQKDAIQEEKKIEEECPQNFESKIKYLPLDLHISR